MKIEKNVSLKKYSTFRVGGAAKFFCLVSNLAELEEVLKLAANKNDRVFVLGGGSNVLFGDDGFNGLVIKIENKKIDIEGTDIICGAGLRLSKLLSFSMENDLVGLEWAAGIPGTVGGAIRGNAGAFGGEMKDHLRSVKVLKTDKGRIEKKENISTDRKNYGNLLQEEIFDSHQCRFGYRSSIFKQERDLIIWEARFNLASGNGRLSEEKIKEIIEKRKSKQPSEPSAGSVFQNPTVEPALVNVFEKDQEMKCRDNKVPAGWLIEEVGLRGKKIGGAQVSEKHANFIVNNGDATAEDVIMLISLIKQKVRRYFNVQLREEIEIVI